MASAAAPAAGPWSVACCPRRGSGGTPEGTRFWHEFEMPRARANPRGFEGRIFVLKFCDHAAARKPPHRQQTEPAAVDPRAWHGSHRAAESDGVSWISICKAL